MSVRMKLTHSKTASRRAHHGRSAPVLVATKTGVRRRHFVDPETGMYRGKQIIVVGGKKEEKVKATKEKTKKDEEKSQDASKKKTQ